jgi:hypothetical protein
MPVGIPSGGGAGEREPGSHESHRVSLDELDDAIVDLRNLRDLRFSDGDTAAMQHRSPIVGILMENASRAFLDAVCQSSRRGAMRAAGGLCRAP